MEKCVIKPQYESYSHWDCDSFILCTDGFREVMELDHFIDILDFLHLVNQTDEAVDKSNKIYKVTSMLDRMRPLFCCYYSPQQQLSLDKGMIPTKIRLAIKQYICDKLVRWGIKSTLAGLMDCHWPLLGSEGCCLPSHGQLKNELGVLAVTIMPSLRHYPKELGKRLTEHSRYKFRCRWQEADQT